MRFMSDFYLTLLLVVVIITWEFDEYLHTRRVVRSVYWQGVTLVWFNAGRLLAGANGRQNCRIA
jgi:hypothetical protein